MSHSSEVERDVFICYASEDRETVAKPLAQLLTALGIRVWFDLFDLKIGDSLRRKVDEGLAICRYGVVVLSPSFFGKHYTNRELNGLAQREVDGRKVILPVWVGVGEREVRQFSPPLADRIAGRWEEGIVTVVLKLAEVIKPEGLEAPQRPQVIPLPRLRTGREVVDVISGSHFGYSFNDDPNDEAEIDLVGGFIQGLNDWCDIWNDVDVPCQMRAALAIAHTIKELDLAGWAVHGSKIKGRRRIAGLEGEWKWHAVAVLRGEPEQVVFMGGKVFAFRPGQGP